jgi:hypothetical protein
MEEEVRERTVVLTFVVVGQHGVDAALREVGGSIDIYA